jgi:hypothetical protein
MTWKLHDPPEMMGVHGTHPHVAERIELLRQYPLHVYHGSSTTASRSRARLLTAACCAACARMRACGVDATPPACLRSRSHRRCSARGHSPALCVCAAVRRLRPRRQAVRGRGHHRRRSAARVCAHDSAGAVPRCPPACIHGRWPVRARACAVRSGGERGENEWACGAAL